MQKIILIISITFFTSIITKAADSSFVILGELSKVRSGTIMLNIYGEDEKKLSSKIINGKFTFKGSTQKPSTAYLSIKDNEKDYLKFYVEPGNIHITGEGSPIKDLVVSNSHLNDDDKILKQQMAPITNWEEANSKIYEEASASKNKTVLDSLDEVDFEVLHAKRQVVASFVNGHPHSLRSAVAITENYAYYAEADEVKPLYNLLDSSIKHSATGTEIKKLIDVYETVAIGMTAPDIKQITPQGTPLSLTSLKDKYVLIDFWASWCPPCRRENPNVVKLYINIKIKALMCLAFLTTQKKTNGKRLLKMTDLPGTRFLIFLDGKMQHQIFMVSKQFLQIFS